MPLLNGVDLAIDPPAPQDVGALDVPLLGQFGDEWCWAACTQMILRFYLDDTTRQCQLAGRLFSPADCCGPPLGCDRPCNASKILKVLQDAQLHSHALNRRATFAELVDEYNADRPVLVGIEREDGTAHLVVVTWAGDWLGREWVLLNDPLELRVGSSSYARLSTVAVEAWTEIWRV